LNPEQVTVNGGAKTSHVAAQKSAIFGVGIWRWERMSGLARALFM
jgi:hypothetical protein